MTSHKQGGVALIIVLLIVSIVSVLATEMGSRLQLQVKRAANIKDNNQAYWYAMGAEQYAQKSIQFLLKNSNGVIHLNQPWSEKFVYPLAGGGIEAQLSDMHACFNLNALQPQNTSATRQQTTQTSEQEQAFKRLLTSIDGNIPTYDVDTLTDSLVDWLDTDDRMQNQGAEDSEYRSRQFPYLAANALMAHPSELRMVNGVKMPWFADLLPMVCVIPGSTELKINVNTIDEENVAVLAAATGLTTSAAQSLIANRDKAGFTSKADFLADNAISALNLSQEQQDWFDVTTAHFVLRTRTKYNNATFSMVTIFAVGKNQTVTVLGREFGIL
ncbi:MAG: general secretion pathway protein K [Paraglaciecola sp.]|jgi:general secretion pathway protein K